MGSSASSISADVSSINVQRADDIVMQADIIQHEETFDVMISYSHADKATMTRLHGEIYRLNGN